MEGRGKTGGAGGEGGVGKAPVVLMHRPLGHLSARGLPIPSKKVGWEGIRIGVPALFCPDTYGAGLGELFLATSH